MYVSPHKQCVFVQLFPPCPLTNLYEFPRAILGKKCINLHKFCVNYTNLGQREALIDHRHKLQITFTQFFSPKTPLLPVLVCYLHFSEMSIGRGFTQVEIDCLLKIIKDILPIGPNNWDRGPECHCSFYPGIGWIHKSLRSSI